MRVLSKENKKREKLMKSMGTHNTIIGYCITEPVSFIPTLNKALPKTLASFSSFLFYINI